VLIRVAIEIPKVEVRFEHLFVEGDAFNGTRALPTLVNSTMNAIEVFFYSYIHVWLNMLPSTLSNLCYPFSFNTKLANPAFNIFNQIKNRPRCIINANIYAFLVTRQRYANEWCFIYINVYINTVY